MLPKASMPACTCPGTPGMLMTELMRAGGGERPGFLGRLSFVDLAGSERAARTVCLLRKKSLLLQCVQHWQVLPLDTVPT